MQLIETNRQRSGGCALLEEPSRRVRSPQTDAGASSASRTADLIEEVLSRDSQVFNQRLRQESGE